MIESLTTNGYNRIWKCDTGKLRATLANIIRNRRESIRENYIFQAATVGKRMIINRNDGIGNVQALDTAVCKSRAADFRD